MGGMTCPPLYSHAHTHTRVALQAIETGYLHPTLNQYNLVDEVSDIDTCAGGKVKHEVR